MNIDKNKFDVYNENETLHELSLDDCILYATTNNYKGFKHNENRNICFINKAESLDNKINIKYKDYNVLSYNKTKNTMDLTLDQDQNDPYNYFTKTNNQSFISKKHIQKSNVGNIEDCMKTCLDDYDGKCKSITYLENPSKCIFYSNSKMKDKKSFDYDYDYDYDVYTLKKNMKHEPSTIKKSGYENPAKSNLEEEEDNGIALYNCDGIYSTNPFCSREYTESDLENDKKKKMNDAYKNYSDCFTTNNINTIQEENDEYNSQCKKKFGDGYIYDNDIYNNDNKLECHEDDEIKIKCKMNLFNNDIINKCTFLSKKEHIEHFNNSNNYNNDSILSMNVNPIMDYLPIFISLFIIMLFVLLHLK
jgi:hypothetical protein